MKAVLRVTLIICIALAGCEKENIDLLVGKWKYVKGYSFIGTQTDYIPEIQDQKIEEYTKKNIRILYDYQGVEVHRWDYHATDSVITIYGETHDGQEYSKERKYWFIHDTLKIRQDGGFEYYDEFFVRID